MSSLNAAKQLPIRFMMPTILSCMVGIIMLVGSCAGRQRDAANGDTLSELQLDSLQAEHDISLDAQQWADSILDSMTIEEMAGQLIMPAVYAADDPHTLRLVRTYAID